ncbi:MULTISPECIES: fimbrial protein [Providencia]|uniref:Fimbrial protein n=3 Tax=Providencia stuartii TaxID=588 RepID=A0AAJ1JFH8_PROST|nr:MULTISPECIES: fimbrial protein [Providencia]SST03686.1 P pilus assembly protein, pilin FimA [Acinetobacter baumannii]AFH94312.1 fimbrial subunit [Providencia stuartii MRSN 2154]EDU58232.1 fimbrial protein [Providencia stuartii ATCC 25827]EMA3640010.1 fimbrial protein [Providencia stuartii]EMD1718417.1 fimbrial protein [Providencia stuartii]
MIRLNKLKQPLGLLLLLTVLESHADVLVDVTATMVDPACNIRSENSSSPLKIGFGTLNPNSLNTSAAVNDFSLYITGCNFNNTLAIVLSPKGGSSVLYNGKNILATSINGLGIDFKEVTGGTVRALEVSKKQRIYPERVDATLYRMDLQAQLVSTVPINQLALGKFTSTVTLSVTYH